MKPRQKETNGPAPDACVRHAREAAEEMAVLYALGSLEPAEARSFEEHMTRECPFCAREAAGWKETVGQLGAAESAGPEGGGASNPPASLRRELIERISAGRTERARSIQVWKEWNKPAESPRSPGLHIVRAAEGEMLPTGVPGVSVKKLSADPDRRYVTMLVKMDPGSSYPCHRHAGVEECYVLQGDLRVGDNLLNAGDYQRADQESLHGVQSTEKGCLLLILSSQDDELS